jgi:predicted RNase H-like HicB family nuclease
MACTAMKANWEEGRRYRRTKEGENAMIFHVTLEQAEDGWIVAECPALPGCISQGRDEQEALENIKEAIAAWLWAEDQKAMADLALQPSRQTIVVAL